MKYSRLKAANFLTHRTLESFDFAAQPSLNRQLVTELLRGELIVRHENVLLVGRHRRAALVAARARHT